MSTLSMRLKQRARMLAAGVALSAATLALIPGVAEATDPTDCVCRVIGDITDTSNPTQGPSDGSQEPSDGPDNSAKLVGLQDTSAADDSLIGNDNVSGNSVGVSAPIASDGSGSEFSNDASSTDNTSSNGGANSPSTEQRNSADLAGAQDTSALNGSEIGNDNVSGNSVSLSTPVLSNDSGSQLDNDASSTDNTGNGNANGPSGDKQNDTDIAGLQDTSAANGAEILNRNASGNSVGVSAPIASDGSGSEFGSDAKSTDNSGSGNGGANGDKQNDAGIAGAQDTSALNGSEIGNDNVSGNSVSLSTPVLSNDSDSRFDNDANSTNGTGGNANSPSGEERNTADIAAAQDTELANGTEILNRNASGNSVGVSAPIASDGSGSEFGSDASSTSSRGNGNANSPGGDKQQNDADVAGLQDTELANDSQIGNGNASGNSVGASGPVLSDDSSSRFNNDASSTSSGGSGNANGPSGDKQNDADVAGSQDTSAANGAEILNRNASGNSVGVSAPLLSNDSDSQFDNDASSTDNTSSGNGGANSPSGEKRNSADLAGAQDTSALNGSQTGNDNASGTSVGVSAPVLSKDSGSRFDNDASSTDNTGNGKANSPSGDKQNDADIAGSQDASVLNGSETLNRNASGNSAGISAPIASDGSGSRFDNDARSTDNGGSGNGGSDNGGSDNGGSDNGGSNDSGKNPNSGNGNGDEAGDPGKSQPNNNGGDDGSPNSGGQTAKS